MEILVLAAIVLGGLLSFLMFAAIVSDLNRSETKRRGVWVLVGSVILSVSPMFIQDPLKALSRPVEVLIVVAIIFGPAAIILYIPALVISWISQGIDRCKRRRNVAA